VTGDPTATTTVVIPVWDSYVFPHLAEAVASLTAQEAPVSIIVVDNASETELPSLDAVEVVRSPERLKLGSARNLGLEHVRTPLVMFWDADDTMLPGTVAFLQQAIGADPRLAAFGAAIVEAPSGQRHRWPRHWIEKAVRFPALFALADCVWTLYPSTGATIMRTDLVRAAGGYGDAESAEDWSLGVSLAFRGRIGWSERPGRIYRIDEGSVWARHMTPRHQLQHAGNVRHRIHEDPGIPRWAKLALPAIAFAQAAAIAAHVVVAAARGVKR
jgi:glycosyltransferase involved in cell wall biosynthesis